jgi:light-regulated signal transduction histidine kinase (bacteriophytochrome)
MTVAVADPPLDLALCDREPIHIPQAIQPQGALLIARADGSRVSHASVNLCDILGVAAEDAIGRPLGRVLGEEATSALLPRGPQAAGEVGQTFSYVTGSGQPLELRSHRSGASLCIDLEPRLPEAWQRPALVATQAILDSFKSANSQRELCDRAVQGLRSLTGYDRVMAYRFGNDGHGEVIAEALAPGLEPYLGQRYPASDIPAQARALYLRQRVGVIADSSYTAVPLLTDAQSAAAPPVDLTHSALRSVSPIHREFMRNMGTTASMTIGLTRGHDAERELWGMLVCHHSTPRAASGELRAVAAMIGQVASLLLDSQGAAEIAAERVMRQDTLRVLTERLAMPGPLIDALTGRPEALLGLAAASAVLVRLHGELRLIGRAPERAAAERLLTLLEVSAATGIGSVEDLGARYPEFAPLASTLSGALWLPLGESGDDVIVWLRPELAQTLTWGGNPTKPAKADPVTGLISPRASFAAWKEIVHGRSLAWSDADHALAGELRRAIEEHVARRGRVALDLFNRIFEASPTALLLIGAGGEIRMLNACAEAVFQGRRADLVGRPADLLLPDRTRPEPMGRRGDGVEFPIELAISPIQPNELTREPMLLASVIDISARLESERQRRQARVELEATNAQLKYTNEELDQFVYSAAHDLRSPLRGIAALTQFVIEDDPSLGTETRERLELIAARADRMRNLLQDMLAYARAGQGAATAPLVPVPLAALLEEVLATLTIPPGFRILADDAEGTTRVVAFPLSQVLRNLVENALKHHDRRTGTVSIALKPETDHLRFTVSDDGPGIAEAFREQVFEMFATLKRRDEVEASGMGLALVRKLVRQHGGRCGIAPASPRGTAVWFEWPKLDDTDAHYLARQ